MADMEPRPQDVTRRLESAEIGPLSESTEQNEDDLSDEVLARYESFGRFLEAALRVPVKHAALPELHTIGVFPVVGILGSGGNGVVYLAEDPTLKRQVAIKVPSGGCLSSSQVRARFMQEARLVAELQHPQIVQILQVGEHLASPYLVFEYCSGGSLAEWLVAQAGAVDLRTSIEIIYQLTRAVQHAHERGILHRDINPRNVLLVPRPSADERGGRSEVKNDQSAPLPFVVKLSDFGLGTWLEARQTAVHTLAGTVMGTLPYMAPEQTTDEHQLFPQPTIDVYALGVMFYELLTGQRPFAGKNSVETLQLIRESEPLSPSRLRRGVFKDCETVCLKCLEKSPERRYQSAASLAEDLENLLHGRPIKALPTSLFIKSARWLCTHRAIISWSAVVGSLIAAIAAGDAWYSRQLSSSRVSELILKLESEERGVKLKLAQESEQRLQSTAVEEARVSRRLIYASQIESVANIIGARPYDARQLLRTWIPQTGETDLRGFEWYYLMQACGGELAPMFTLAAGNENIEAMHVSEAGDSVFVAQSRQLIEWDVRTGQRKRVVAEFPTPIRDFSISPTRRQLAVSLHDSSDIEILNLTGSTARLQAYCRGVKPFWCQRMIFSRDESALMSIWGDTIAIQPPCQLGTHLLASHEWNWKVVFPRERVLDLAFDPLNGTTICTTGVSVQVYDKGPAPLQSLALSDKWSTNSLAVSPDGKLLAVSTEKREILMCQKDAQGKWEFRDRLPVTNLRDRPHHFAYGRNPVRFTARGTRLFSAYETELHLWDTVHSKDLCSAIQLPGFEVRYMEVLPDGKTAVWNTEKTLGLWRPIEPVTPIAGHSKEAWSVAYSPDGKLLATGSDDETVRLWDLETSQLICELRGHVATVTEVAFSPDGKLLASSSLDESVRIWDVDSRSLLKKLDGHTGPVRSLAWFADGKRLVTADSPMNSDPRRVLVWNIHDNKIVAEARGLTDRVEAVVVTRDQKYIIGTSDDRQILVCDADTGKLERSWSDNSGVVCATLLNHDLWLATGTNSGVIRIWEIATGAMLKELNGHTSRVLSVALSPDGRVIASGSVDTTVRLWDAESGHPFLVMNDHASQINCVAFSPNGETLAVAAHDGSVIFRHGPRFEAIRFSR